MVINISLILLKGGVVSFLIPLGPPQLPLFNNILSYTPTGSIFRMRIGGDIYCGTAAATPPILKK